MSIFKPFITPRRQFHCAGVLSLLLAVGAAPAHAETLAPVHLRVAGRELKCKISPLTDGKETYVPLEVLKAVGATAILNARQDAATVWTQRRQRSGELAIARPGGKPMLPLSDLARLLDARIEQPDAKGASGKPLLGKRGDTVYLLARLTTAHYEDGMLRVVTSFPVPYHARTLKGTRPVKAYLDCAGATIADGPTLDPLANGETAVLRLRAGQNTIETARIVLELRDGATLKACDSPANAAPLIRVGLETAPTRIADTSLPQPTDTAEIQFPTVPNENPAPNTQHPIPNNPRPPSSRGGKSVHPDWRREAVPITVQGLRLRTQDAQSVRLEIGTTGRVSPYAHYQQNATQLVIEIPNASLKLPDAAQAEQSFSHPLVRGLHAEQLAQTPPVTRVTLDMNRVVGFSVDSEAAKIALDLRVPRNATGALADKLIVIDAGHGGSSSGAVGRGGDGTHYEKGVTLGIAMKLRALLEAAGARVVMTRDRDIDVALYDRPRLANDIRADLFVSIHNDSNAHPDSASGTSTYYHMNDPSSRALATCVQQAVSAVTGLPSRGALSDGILYQNGLAVLRVSSMPAVLCEVAYINNSRDRRKLIDADFQQKVAAALCRGIRTYVEGAPVREKTVPLLDAPPADEEKKKTDSEPDTE